jgi:hypothetical protein
MKKRNPFGPRKDAVPGPSFLSSGVPLLASTMSGRLPSTNGTSTAVCDQETFEITVRNKYLDCIIARNQKGAD